MDIQQLRYFKTVAQIGKISEAAEILNISAPALSTSINRLEKELDARLFNRTNNRIILNEQGEIFLRYTEQILNAANCAKAELQQSKQATESHLHIAYTGVAIWSGLVIAFMQEHPEISFACSSTNGVTLRTDGLPAQSNLFLSADENLLMPSPSGFVYNRLKDLFYINNLSLPHEKDYPYLTRRQMVAKNLGISFSSKYNTSADNLPVCAVPLEDPIGSIPTSLFWRKAHKLTRSEQIFVDFTKQHYMQLDLH